MAVEDELKMWPTADKLRGALLAMRVKEKDFLLYGDADALSQHRKFFNQFDFALGTASLDPATAERLGGLARTYRKDLQDLARTTEVLQARSAALGAALDGLRPPVAALLERARTGMADAFERQDGVRSDALQTAIALGAA